MFVLAHLDAWQYRKQEHYPSATPLILKSLISGALTLNAENGPLVQCHTRPCSHCRGVFQMSAAALPSSLALEV